MLLGLQQGRREDRDREGLVLRQEELSRRVDPVLEVVSDARMLSLVDRLEPVVPPADERRTLGLGSIGILLGEPIVPGAVVLVGRVDGGARGAEVIGRGAAIPPQGRW